MQSTAAQDQRDYQVFKRIFFYCFNILALPITTFILSRCLLDGVFEFTAVRSNVLSAVAAVVALHFALGLFIYRAYFGDTPKPESKRD